MAHFCRRTLRLCVSPEDVVVRQVVCAEHTRANIIVRLAEPMVLAVMQAKQRLLSSRSPVSIDWGCNATTLERRVTSRRQRMTAGPGGRLSSRA